MPKFTLTTQECVGCGDEGTASVEPHAPPRSRLMRFAALTGIHAFPATIRAPQSPKPIAAYPSRRPCARRMMSSPSSTQAYLARGELDVARAVERQFTDAAVVFRHGATEGAGAEGALHRRRRRYRSEYAGGICRVCRQRHSEVVESDQGSRRQARLTSSHRTCNSPVLGLFCVYAYYCALDAKGVLGK